MFTTPIMKKLIIYKLIHCLNILHPMVTNWTVMAARAQTEQAEKREFNFEYVESKTDSLSTYVQHDDTFIDETISSSCNKMFMYVPNTNEYLHLRGGAPTTLRFRVTLIIRYKF